ncbi:hypothetical protein [Lyngbya confervoides]|uniref:ACT domain-containing protein n=1 Tax=Lyngbya confervoides BDU141951 TaxID=1574623 RepID=A0ABD4SZH0_9CYAN|nr:hypothetical protein [Lyngbya confervoides]MCM1981768.1 hypothetical protein [Lyngbya confervoides BDU141951]
MVVAASQTCPQDIVTVKAFDESDRSLLFRMWGRDRPGIVAHVTSLLEADHLYVGSITFNLLLPEQHQYEMEIVAKGGLDSLRHLYHRIQANHFLHDAPALEASPIYWPTAYMLHLALNTPDQEGLIAKISEIVGQPRQSEAPCGNGSFVHLVGLTHNSGGPEGGTAYFSVRANIASQCLQVQNQIVADLQQWAAQARIGKDLWLRDLNPEV